MTALPSCEEAQARHAVHYLEQYQQADWRSRCGGDDLGNLGSVYEQLGDYERALTPQEQLLVIGAYAYVGEEEFCMEILAAV